MIMSSRGKRLWIVDEIGQVQPVASYKDITGKPRVEGHPDWWVEEKDPDWTPPPPTSLLSMTAANVSHFEAGPGGGAGGMKIGAGHKPQGYDEHGRYTGPGEGQAGSSKAGQNGNEPLNGVLLADSGQIRSDAGGGLSNEDRRLEEKKFTPERLVQNAKSDIGSDEWKPKEVNGKLQNQCNVFVASKLRQSGAHVPNVGGWSGALGEGASDAISEQTGGAYGGHPPSANDWFNGKVPGWEQVDGEKGERPMPGDVATNGTHVGIVSGEGKTISVTTDRTKPETYGNVVENTWGFRPDNHGSMRFLRRVSR